MKTKLHPINNYQDYNLFRGSSDLIPQIYSSNYLSKSSNPSTAAKKRSIKSVWLKVVE